MGERISVSVSDEPRGREMMLIGLEIHVQLPTRSKLFCRCPNTTSDDPNSTVCPTCLGMPGSKPSVNRRAIVLAVTAARTLHFTLLERVWFSRKTYFYPDLAKNFQITQFEAPIGSDGYLDIRDKRVRLSRIHLEEDPARAVHELTSEQQYSLIDYNRSGIPLIEIVTMPDMDDPAQAREFMRVLLSELRFVGVVLEGEDLKIRVDANISLEGGERVEIKNITGLKNLERALEFEFRRQSKLLKAGMDVKRETRSFDEERGVTFSSREKEEEQEYGYIFEPDLPVFDLEALADEISLPETAHDVAAELSNTYNLPIDEVRDLILDAKPLGKLLDRIAREIDPPCTLHWLSTVVKSEYYRHLDRDLDEIEWELKTVISADAEGKISSTVAKSAIRRIFETGEAGDLVKLEKSDIELDEIVTRIIEAEPQLVDEVRKQPKAINHLIGRVMKETEGKYDPKKVAETISRMIAEDS